ncbi:MAG: tRNA (adenosine(37)-N6)-threonylcarbamoyltransferase complex dimerization subunit type 1 TsaB [Candidatus Makana argininalis]
MSINILSINTSTEACSVAIMNYKNIILDYFIISPYAHMKYILKMIDRLLYKFDMNLKKINIIAVSKGPGSFNGIRIGIGIAYGLSISQNIPIIGVSNLNTLAEGAWRKTGSCKVLTLIKSNIGEFYWAEYQRKKNIWKLNNQEFFLKIKKIENIFLNLKGFWSISGIGWKNITFKLNKKINIFSGKYNFPKAKDMIPIALNKYIRKEYDNKSFIKPNYLNNKIIFLKK